MVHNTVFFGIIFNIYVFLKVNFLAFFSKGSKTLGLPSIYLDNIDALWDDLCKYLDSISKPEVKLRVLYLD